MDPNKFPDFEKINIDNFSGRDIEITIQCTTYNQADYIKQALDNFISQCFTENYEILIFDDASTDGTSDIVREYASKYPDKIKALIALENTYRHPLNAVCRREIRGKYSLGKYVAFCEGDDYWIDDNKLQKQWEALEQHPECDMCACRASMVSENGNIILGEIRPQKFDGTLSVENVISGGGNYVATAGVFFRKSLFDTAMRFETVVGLDYAWQIRGALRGGIYYLDEPMAAYRRYSKISVTSQITRKREAMVKQIDLEKMVLRTLDEETKGEYHDVIVARLKDYDITFYDQLRERKDEIMEVINSCHGKKYLWGRGLRGECFERFCSEENIELEGVCDITDQQIGDVTRYGNVIHECKVVLRDSDVIFASVNSAYKYLIDLGVNATVYNLQEYMSKV